MNTRFTALLVAACSMVAGLTILAEAAPAAAATGDITTVGGAGSGDGRQATAVGLDAVNGVAVDALGNIYVGERFAHRVRRVDAVTGVITTFAGTGESGGTGNGGQAVNASLVGPIGLAYGPNDNSLYIGDGNVIRKVDIATGVITHFAGNGSAVDGGSAATARFQDISALFVDGAGSVYVADHIDNRIRKISAGIITTVAGLPALTTVAAAAGNTGDGGPATAATLDGPEGVAVDPAGNIYISDSGNRRVREVVAATGDIVAFAGGGVSTVEGISATTAKLSHPGELTVVGSSVLFADSQAFRIRSVTAGIITTFAGTGLQAVGGDGLPAVQASLYFAKTLTSDAAGNVFAGDYYPAQVRRFAAAGQHIASTVAGDSSQKLAGNGAAAVNALLGSPSDVVTLSNGDVVFSDSQANTLRRISAANGTISIWAGTGAQGFAGDGGPASSAQLSSPRGLAVDGNDSVYVADVQNARVRKITSAGVISTITGTGQFSHSGDGGPATDASLQFMSGIVMTSTGDLLVVENGTRLRRIDHTTGVITTIAGTGANVDAGDSGLAVNASFTYAYAVAVDAADDIYVLDANARKVRRIDATTGVITTIAGTGSSGSTGDGGPAASATFKDPLDLVVDGASNIYIADYSAHRVRRIDATTHTITTLAGTGAAGYGGDNGPASAATMLYPSGLTVDRLGNVLIADAGNQRVRKVATVAVPFVPPTPPAPPVPMDPPVVPPVVPVDPPPVVPPVDTPAGGPSSRYHPVQPERLLDTRVGLGAPLAQLEGDHAVVLQVTGVGSSNTPSDARAVALNITATGSAAPGYVTVWPCGQPRPTASNLNIAAGATRANLAIVKLGDDGTVCLYTQSTLDLIADINGWFPAGSDLTAVQPERLLDTRDGTGSPMSPLGSDHTLVLQVAGAGQTAVPTGAGAVVLNVTATDVTAPGFVTVWPCGQPRPTASNLNLVAGQTAPNLAIVKLGDNGTVCFYTQSTLDLIADIDGWFPTTSDLTSVQPERLLDTRISVGAPAGQLAADHTLVLQVTGLGDTQVPADAKAVVLNITATGAAAPGYVTVWPCGQPRPTASSLNVATGQTTPNLAIVKLGDNGTVCLYSQSTLDLIADVSGWFAT